MCFERRRKAECGESSTRVVIGLWRQCDSAQSGSHDATAEVALCCAEVSWGAVRFGVSHLFWTGDGVAAVFQCVRAATGSFQSIFGVLSLFMKHLLARTSPTIFGDGEQSRDFTYVEDVASLCVKAARAPGWRANVYAGNGGRYTLNLIWKLLQEMEGVEIPVNYGEPRAGDVQHSMADTTAAAQSWSCARFTMEEGLERTLEWYRQYV